MNNNLIKLNKIKNNLKNIELSEDKDILYSIILEGLNEDTYGDLEDIKRDLKYDYQVTPSLLKKYNAISRGGETLPYFDIKVLSPDRDKILQVGKDWVIADKNDVNKEEYERQLKELDNMIKKES